MADYGTGINPKGIQVTLVGCEKCGNMYAIGAPGHENPAVAASTDRHKMAAARETAR